MFFLFLFATSTSTQLICVCNGFCDAICPDFYDTSTDDKFENFLNFHLNNETKTGIVFYSKYKGYRTTIDTTIFGNRKVKIQNHQNSEVVTVDFKGRTTIEIKPNYQIILPNLITIPITSKKRSKDYPQEGTYPSTIPISVTVAKMKVTGSGYCNKKTSTGTTDFEFHNKIDIDINDIYCDYQSLDTPAAYDCGIRCWGSDVTYEYTFKGEQFAIYGTKCEGNYKFNVELDGEIIAQPDEHLDGEAREERVLVYTSPVLEYNEHTVRIIHNGQTYEIYKLVYWPSIVAKRFNSTQFHKEGTGWKDETDGIGGVRSYTETEGGAKATISLFCTKFWLYGLNDDNFYDMYINYNDQTVTVNQNCPKGERKEGILLYESPELDKFNITLTITVSSGTTFIYCVYFDEPPIPVSIAIFQMERNNIENCGYYLNDSIFDINSVFHGTTQNIGCPKSENADLSIESSYTCGIRCWGKSTYSYTFKGVKFAVFGTYNNGHGSYKVLLDNVQVGNVQQSCNTAIKHILQFESDRLVYKTHSIVIQSNNDDNFELYKIVYWPSLRSKRVNSTEFTAVSNTFKVESDGIGGIRRWSDDDEHAAASYHMLCSRFWYYSITASDHKGIHFVFSNVVDKTENAIT